MHLHQSPVGIISLLALINLTHAAPITRVANDTLRLPATLPQGSFKTEVAFEGVRFTRPVGIVTPPGETRRLFILEQRGVISVIPDLEAPQKETFLDLSADTAFQGESGLLGLAFHPQYASNRTFYVFYTTRIDGQRIQRVARFLTDSQNANRALRDSEQPLIDQVDEASNHNGGDLHFGPDGYLYIALGDEGGANDRYDNGRFLDRDFFAAIARIDVDKLPGSLPPNAHPAVYPDTYTIPPDNPFIGTTTFLGNSVNPEEVRTEFWAVGLRNPWRMHFDQATGRLYVGDVGQSSREEINVIERGKHYGWSYREGTRRFTSGPGRANEPDTFTPAEPLWDYPRSEGVSVTGGVVYRGEAHTELYEAYLFGDYGSGRIWALHENDDDSVRVEEIASDDSISAFGLDPRNGDVLFCAYDTGDVKRIARRSSGFTLLIPQKLSQTGAFSDLETLTPEVGIVPYEPRVPFWSDGADKQRWFSVPDIDATIDFHPEEPWTFPVGTTWIKHFELGGSRLETRFLVKTDEGSYGLTYAWNEAQTDADLVDAEGETRLLAVNEPQGVREQPWTFPSRNACRACHTRTAGHALSFHTAQLHRDYAYPEETANQLAALSDAGYFSAPLPALDTLPALASSTDNSQSLEARARAYLATNCAQCHQPGGPALGFWDARAHVPLEETGIIKGMLVNNLGDADYQVVHPGRPERSMIFSRLLRQEGLPPMPPLATHQIDADGVALIEAWIRSLGGGYDSWAETFGQAMALSDPSTDADRDGASNFSEYLADTHPLRPEDRWLPALEHPTRDGRYLLVPRAERARIEIERSVDAAHWEPWKPQADTIESLPNGTQRIRLSEDAPRAFHRFRLLEVDR